MAQHITVVDHNPAWAAQYAAEAEKLRAVLGENCTAIHHIGSTAVPGLKAKPILDIMPVVRDLRAVDRAAGDFRQLGYEYLGEFGIPGRALPAQGRGRAHASGPHLSGGRHRKYRAAPRRARLPADARCGRRPYGALKARLAQAFPYDIEGYCDGKDAFVQALEKEALALAESARRAEIRRLTGRPRSLRAQPGYSRQKRRIRFKRRIRLFYFQLSVCFQRTDLPGAASGRGPRSASSVFRTLCAASDWISTTRAPRAFAMSRRSQAIAVWNEHPTTRNTSPGSSANTISYALFVIRRGVAVQHGLALQRPRRIHLVVLRQAAVQLDGVAARRAVQAVDVHRDDRDPVFRERDVRVVRLCAVHVFLELPDHRVVRRMVRLRKAPEQLLPHVGRFHEGRDVALLRNARACKRQNLHPASLLSVKTARRDFRPAGCFRLYSA